MIMSPAGCSFSRMMNPARRYARPRDTALAIMT
jgi:hypothetical protein